MGEWGATREDVHGATVRISFAECLFKVGVTSDIANGHPVERIEQLETLDWLSARASAARLSSAVGE